MSEFKTYNEKGIEIKVTEKDFELVQKDQKIHDVKFESKPTTFWKDAFKRFCKNKIRFSRKRLNLIFWLNLF